MSAINHQELRELATDLQRMATPQKLLAFRRNALAVCCAGAAG
ncbi:Uncharacterised protein [Escherichia coli]|nr:Uncharacterised protein [Escherichia coli]